jgi:hypothetical protein
MPSFKRNFFAEGYIYKNRNGTGSQKPPQIKVGQGMIGW